MATIHRIVTSQVEGRTLSDDYESHTYVFSDDGLLVRYRDGQQGQPILRPGEFYGAGYDSGDGNGYNTIKLIPHAPGGSPTDDRYIIIDPTAPNHIHIRAGGNIDQANAQLILGGENNHVAISDVGVGNEVVIKTTDIIGEQSFSRLWIFYPSGDIQFPTGGVQRAAYNISRANLNGAAVETPTTIDTVNGIVRLAITTVGSDYFHLADGQYDGQVMRFLPGSFVNLAKPTDIRISVGKLRYVDPNDGELYEFTNVLYVPFLLGTQTALVTAVFVDGYWSFDGGAMAIE